MKNCVHRVRPINQKVNRCNTQLWKTKSICKTKLEWDKTRCNCDRSDEEQQNRIYCHMLNKIYSESERFMSLFVGILHSGNHHAFSHYLSTDCVVLCAVAHLQSYILHMHARGGGGGAHSSIADGSTLWLSFIEVSSRFGVSTIFQIYFTCTLCVCCWFCFFSLFFASHFIGVCLRFVVSLIPSVLCVARCTIATSSIF